MYKIWLINVVRGNYSTTEGGSESVHSHSQIVEFETLKLAEDVMVSVVNRNMQINDKMSVKAIRLYSLEQIK